MIGILRHQITIQKKEIIKDEIGQEKEVWKDFKTVWASIEPLAGREYFAAKQINSEVSVKITIRFLEGMTSAMNIIFKEHRYDIVSVSNLEERNRYLQLLCSEKVGDDID